MDRKIFGILFLVTLAIIIGVAGVNGLSVILDVPKDDTSYSNNISVGVLANNVPQLQNCTVYAKSASTANSSWVNVGFFQNTTANASAINGTFNTSFFEDANNYQVNASCRMTNGTLTEDVNTGITFDNTIPTAPSSLTPATNTLISSSSTAYSLSSTVNNANTISCTYTIARGGATSGADYITGAGTYSASNCSFTKNFTDTLDNGEWWWYVTASDGTNTTSVGQIVLQVAIPSTGGNTCVSSGGTIVNEQCICPQGKTFDSGYGCYDTANPPSGLIITSTPDTTQDYSWIYWIIGILVVIGIAYVVYKSQ